MAKARYKGPNYSRPHSTEFGYFNPAAFDDPPRSYAPTSTRKYEPPCVKADRREAVAFHEAGHCVVSLAQGRNVHSLSIDDDGGGSFRGQQPLGVTEEKEGLIFEALAEDVTSDFRPSAFRQIVGYLGGYCAELRLGSDPDEARDCASVDLYRARRMAEQVCDGDDDAEQFLRNAQRKADGHVERNWNLVSEIASELNARGRLTGDDVAAIVENYPIVMPPPKRAAAPPVKRRLPHALVMRREPPPADARSFDKATREVDAIISTGRAVRRSDWSGEFDEVLDVTPSAIRLERLNGGAQLLDHHRWYGGLDSVIGAVVPGSARIEGGELRARFKISNGALGQRVAKDLADGLPLQLSAGYRIHAYKEDVKSDPPVRRVVDWEPFEVSIVSVPAESVGTGFRSRAAA